MIRGYAEQPSPRPGERLTLRAATNAPEFRVEFYRCGAALELCGQLPWQPGQDAPLHLPFSDWGARGIGLQGEPLAPWPAYQFDIPADWTSGVYLALFVEGDKSGRDVSEPDRTTPDGRNARAIFVVRAAPDRAARILYKIPLLTYHAYNLAGDVAYDPKTRRGHWCLYNMPQAHETPAPILPAVNLHRPGGAAGATPYDTFNFDPFDPTPRQTFVHWDARFIRWLEDEEYALDFCTDVDLHRFGSDLLAPYRLMVSAGHEEYWTAEMRLALEGHVAAGGNAAFFSGNTCWWRVVFHDDLAFSRIEYWHEAGWPENTTVGVSFRNGGERDRDEHPLPVGYRVQHADHWVYANTGLREGDVFGGEGEYIVGYECDGTHFDRADLEAGRAVAPNGSDGTPADF
ncbi:MAG TPA: N,N-dimethylformamidase beta subunit family domain-containing protein, partial [Thermomicrobiales bacterium]|nr:N,N-dimethylformamidase beta subunit family domain-containing protein [Thermomicrobiales bacterium]